jgi:hypothetical protein
MKSNYDHLPPELAKNIRIAVSMFALSDERQGTFDFKEALQLTNDIMKNINDEIKKRDDVISELKTENGLLQSKIDNLRMGGNENGR